MHKVSPISTLERVECPIIGPFVAGLGLRGTDIHPRYIAAGSLPANLVTHLT
jgi:hypothetical protein